MHKRIHPVLIALAFCGALVPILLHACQRGPERAALISLATPSAYTQTIPAVWRCNCDCEPTAIPPTVEPPTVTPGPPPAPDVRYYDAAGREQSEAWAVDRFGTKDISDPGRWPQWDLAEMHEGNGDHRTLSVRVLSTAGLPQSGVEVALGPYDVGGAVQRTRTDADGYATFSIASDTYKYYVPGHAHWVIAVTSGGDSDVVNWIGWVGRTDPKRWQNVVFQRQEAQPPTPIPPTVTPPPGCPSFQVFDFDVQPATREWLYATFGPVAVSCDGTGARVTALNAQTGPAVLIAHVQDRDAKPVEGVTVVRYWPGAPELPEGLWHGSWHQGVYGPTNINGDIGFGLGVGDYYWPPSVGASVIWIGGAQGEAMTGLGMIAATNHNHINPTFTLSGAGLNADRAWGYSSMPQWVDYAGGRLAVVGP